MAKHLPWYLRGAYRLFGHEISPVAFQEIVDISTAAMAIKYGELSREKPRLEVKDLERLRDEVSKIRVEEQRDFVIDNLNKQVREMFEALHNVLSYKEDKHKLMLPSKPPSSPEEAETIRQHLVRTHGFALHLQKSSIPDAGNGVFLRGSVAPGTVLALHPGEIHLYEYVMHESYRRKLFPDDDLFLTARYDHTYIDGRTAQHMPYNPYALAHMVNHPPPGRLPNVMQLSYDFPTDPFAISLDDFPRHLRRYVPNVYAKKPTWYGTWDRSAFMRTVVLLSMPRIKDGDELLVDYRLNPKAPRPEWYVPRDDEAAARRWAPPEETDYDLVTREMEAQKADEEARLAAEREAKQAEEEVLQEAQHAGQEQAQHLNLPQTEHPPQPKMIHTGHSGGRTK